MLEKSTLNDKLIKQLVFDKYDIIVSNIHKIDRGSANIYNLDDKYILKEFSSDREVDSIIKEYNVIKYLSDNKMRVPDYVLTKDKECYIKYNDRIIILQVYLSGYSIPNNQLDYDKTMESATILGRLTKILQGYDYKTEYDEYPTYDELIKGKDKISELISKINDDNPFKDRIISDLNKRMEIIDKLTDFDFDSLRKVTLMLCHGDYSVQQLIYNDEMETAVIDFETVRTMPVVWEIIRSYSYADKEAKDGKFNIETFINYVCEVMKYIKLTKYDLKYMPYIYLFQLVSSTFGYKQYNNDYSKKCLLDFAFFRTGVCDYLYENLEILSNELEKLED